MEMNRTDERIKVMQALYQVFLFLENKEDFDATEVLLSQFGKTDVKEIPAFSRCVYSLALENYDAIREEIASHLVNWTFERLDDVCKAILFEAVSEGRYAKLAPRKVVISEAVKMSKNYLKDGDHRFVNAALDKSIPAYDSQG